MLNHDDQDTRRYLEQQSEVDAETAQRLDAIRAEAVALSERASDRWTPAVWLPRAGYAAAFSTALVAAALLLQPAPATDDPEALPLELVLLGDDFEMLQQDLAFYAWLASEADHRG